MSETSVKEGLSEIIDATRAMSEGDFSRDINTKMQGEMGELARYIDKTRKSLQKLDPAATVTANNIPHASNQLFDIAKATEEGTHKVLSITEKILDNQDAISNMVKELRDVATSKVVDSSAILKIARDVEAATSQNKDDLVEILTSLSFQDLTGQKIKKIVALVEDVETRILEILIAFGIKKMDEGKRHDMMEQLKVADPALKQDLVDDILKNLGM